MSLVESDTKDVSTARSDQFEEYQLVNDVQQRLDEMQFGEEDDGEESLVEMTALDDVTGADLSNSVVSTGYDGSVTNTSVDFSSMENLTDDLNSIYSDNEKSEMEVECPSYFYVSSVGKAVAMDSIEALDKLDDFHPIPVGEQKIEMRGGDIELAVIGQSGEITTTTPSDFTTAAPFDSLALFSLEKASLYSMAEYTAHAGDTDSTSTCPYQDYSKDAAITERADLTSYCLAPSQTDVTVAAVDEGLVENDNYSTTYVESSERLVEMTDGAKSPVAADMTVYTMPKSERDVEISEAPVTEDFCTVYSYEASDVERMVEIMDTHSSYTEGPSEIECGL